MSKETDPRLAKIKAFFEKHTVYMVGVVLGLTLLIINVYIGLSMVNLLLDEQERDVFKGGISLPVIRVQDYEEAKKEYNRRQTKQPLSDGIVDPFRL